jgi:hypothetical protein
MVDDQNGYYLIQERRSALEKILKLAVLIERLNRTLEGVLISGTAESEMPQQASRYYDLLDEQYLSLPDKIIGAHLKALELRIGSNVRLILQLTRIVNGSNEVVQLPDKKVDLAGFVNEFVHDTNLMVGLRVLLYKRGVATRKLQLEVPRLTIESRLQQMELQEARHRDRARMEIRHMQQDITALIANPSIDESMRNMLAKTYMELEQAFQHIERDGPLSEIPVIVESISLSSEPMSCDEFKVEVESADHAEEVPSAPAETKIKSATITTAEEPVTEKLSFWQTLKVWLNTPLRVSWTDIRKSRKK